MFAELHCLSNFSFQRGASSAQELVERAQSLGYAALAITDECSMAGAVRALQAAQAGGFKLIHGAEFRCEDGLRLVLLAPELAAYQQICALITCARRRAGKGQYQVRREDFESGLEQCLALWIPSAEARREDAEWVARVFRDRGWIGYGRFLQPDDGERLQHLSDLGRQLQLPLVAANDVHMHVRERRRLQDVLTAIRLGTTVQAAGKALFGNGERHLRPIETLRRLYPEALLQESLRIAERCHFGLRELHYEYPHELTPDPSRPAIEHLRRLTGAGLASRYRGKVPQKVLDQVDAELQLIEELKYEHFFLTVEDLVRYARSRGILCQGRGSAANSAVCYALGVTEVDPATGNLLFGRFLSRERNEPPDIDIDFEHQRREEVIQYIYTKYGRERAALAATVISYRRDSAIRDVGKALGFAESLLAALTKNLAWWDQPQALRQQCADFGLDVDAPLFAQLLECVYEIHGFPRHLSQHVGGFVISDAPLWQLVPLENAAMPGRTVIQWDKNDLEELGLLKVDCLALGMLSAIRHSLALLSRRDGRTWSMQDIPREDPLTYELIGHADTVGVFQIESRAQMSMLPRLKPRTFYDLVIEVAIVRPGPIQGGMVHPYLRRRQGLEPVSYPSAALRGVLERTLGVPLFQEQVMQIAMVAAGFTAGEADQLRRAMAAWTRKGNLQQFRDKLVSGMLANGYDLAFAERIFEQIKGFADYGFPESHSASFALLTYLSCWFKCREPAAFIAGLLNAQPLGFYAPAQLVNDARRAHPWRRGIRVLPVDVRHSDWLSTLEPDVDGMDAVRLGLSLVRGLPEDQGRRVEVWRHGLEPTATPSVDRLMAQAQLTRRGLNALAEAGALESLAGHRHAARWRASGAERLPGMLAEAAAAEPELPLPSPQEGQDIAADYNSLGLSLRRHPMALLRARLQRMRLTQAVRLADLPSGRRVRVAGIVTHRQRPGTAAGVVFATLEDETGNVNLIIWPKVFERYRGAALGARLMQVAGELQNEHGVIHVIAAEIEDRSAWLGTLTTVSRDFH